MAMSFSGISSGLPTDQMIQAIISQESLPIERLQARQTANTQKRTTLTTIKNALTALATSINSLNANILNKRIVTSSDSSAVSASASGALSGNYDIQVSQLATKARMETKTSLSSPSDSVGDAGDTYTIVNKDGAKKTITLQGGKTSLADLADAINASGSGVTASVVQKKPGEYHLVLSSADTGEGAASGGDNRDKVGIYFEQDPANAPGGTGNALGLATSKDMASTTGVLVTAAAQNAKFTLNGTEMERKTNTIDDAVDGVTFTLNKADADRTVSLKVDTDTDTIAKTLQDVVNKYNTAYNAYKQASGKGGNLSGEMSIQTIFSQLRTSITGTIEGANWNTEGGSVNGTVSLALLGISTSREGTLSLDSGKLLDALRQNPDMVGKVFDKASGDTKGLIDRLTTAGGGVLTTIINGIDNSNSLMSKQIDDIQAKITRKQEMLKAQFAKMESLIGTMQAAGQSLAALW